MAGITQAERERRDRLYEQGLKDCSACGRACPELRGIWVTIHGGL